MRISTL